MPPERVEYYFQTEPNQHKFYKNHQNYCLFSALVLSLQIHENTMNILKYLINHL